VILTLFSAKLNRYTVHPPAFDQAYDGKAPFQNVQCMYG
jgi:hypothetical protein